VDTVAVMLLPRALLDRIPRPITCPKVLEHMTGRTEHLKIVPGVVPSVAVAVMDYQNSQLKIPSAPLATLQCIAQQRPMACSKLADWTTSKSLDIRIRWTRFESRSSRVFSELGSGCNRMFATPKRVRLTPFLIARHLAEPNRATALLSLADSRRGDVKLAATGLAGDPTTPPRPLLGSELHLIKRGRHAQY